MFVCSTIAQNVNIPDANFKARLIALGVDTNGDGGIQMAEAQAVTSLDVSSSSITNMIGIEAFTSLTTLICNNNQLTSLENIQLADSFSNEPESHGYVVFKLKTKNTLPQNSSVSNKSEIYFDFNPPIITNVATTTFTNTVSILPETQLAFRCYPNPAQNSLTIETQTPQTLTILNAIGKVIQEISVSDKQEIDISAFAPGMYYLKNEHAGVSFVKE